MNGEIAPNEQMLQMASSSRRDRLNEPQNSLGSTLILQYMNNNVYRPEK